MRIDSNMPTVQAPGASERAGVAGTAGKGTGKSAEKTGDVTQLSTGLDAVNTLRAKLNAVPEVRQARIESLRQAIGSGSYAISPDQIAGSMLNDSMHTA